MSAQTHSLQSLPPILRGSDFAEIDRHFAAFIAGFGSGDLPAILAGFLSRNIRDGHICLSLAWMPRLEDRSVSFQWPDLQEWQAALKLNRAIGGPEDGRPVVIDSANRCYLRRYWEYEKRLAQSILARCSVDQPANMPENENRQETAIQAALLHRFTVISGGPGTGKTTTVLKILTGLIGAAEGQTLRIALCAPTGKAAARLQETLASNSGNLPGLQPASTLHRLLGYRPGTIEFVHNAKNLLPVDVVVVDEASMVPLTLMAKLFDALPPNARVILLGDRDQLASVEPGAVLGDIAEASTQPSSPLAGHLVQLEKNWRFGNESSIFALCTAVRHGDSQQASALLQRAVKENLADLASSPTPSVHELYSRLRAPIVAGFKPYLQALSVPGPEAAKEALNRFSQFRVLCALRSGPYGVENLNHLIAGILRSEGLISGSAHAYAGMPLLVTANDYALRLFNGDIGLLMPDPNSGSLLAFFATEDGGVRSIAPARLPAHEPAFAMTVHKSQGSEFGNVLMILPDKPSPVLTRELVYTGLTRARARVELWSNPPILQTAIANLLKRESGLRDLL